MTRNVLFSFVGETPQVVTETLFCLLRDYGTLGGEVHLLTTKNMENNAINLIESENWIKRFNDVYDTEWKPCTDTNFAWENNEKGVQVLRIEKKVTPGKDKLIPIKDINDKAANDVSIDAITRIIYYWTSRDDVELYVSVAGGRKQLGSYMYQALSWFGQPNRTKLCHVILAEELEGGNPDGWVAGYFPKPGSGNSPKEKAEKAPGGKKEKLFFVEQPVIYLKRFLPNFFGVSKIIDFTRPYLDEEEESAKFPFIKEVNLGNYLTFESMCHRYDFMQGLFKDSPEPVQVFLDIENKNFIIISNKSKKSLHAEDMTLFLFYFLYKIQEEDFKVFGKKILLNFLKEKKIFVKFLKKNLKENLAKKLLKKNLVQYLLQSLVRTMLKSLVKSLSKNLSKNLVKKTATTHIFLLISHSIL